ncbi:hypothetical protein Cgig2_008563 [Carnegiea gigantea]|uniref:Uncharacterized protein n=1 Tax=Carnegiea gigantea TaxID=171969 RepID=A0A9Q1JRB2_9CARY|nr:hypothetical protein Cgig2_008563 [Carnegiea gigantea]
MSLECFSLANPNPTLPFNNRASSSSSSSLMAAFSSSPSVSHFFLQSQSFHRHRRPFLVARMTSPPLKGFGCGISMVKNSPRKNLRIVTFATSHEQSEPSEAEIDVEKNELHQAGKESQEAWEQTLAAFKEQALKLQSVSQEAYEVYSKKAAVILREAAEQLKIQAEQARKDLTVMAKELSEEGREYLTAAAENSPEPVKDVVETFASADELDDVSKVLDFYVGIPYGALLSVGGFVNFMLTGSISALRFGVILGGILLALSVSSLRAWRKGKTTDMTLKGQAAIAGILFLRDLRLLFQDNMLKANFGVDNELKRGEDPLRLSWRGTVIL